MKNLILGLVIVFLLVGLAFAGEKEDLMAEKAFLERQIIAILERMQMIQQRFQIETQDRATAYKRLGDVETRIEKLKKEEPEKKDK